MLSSLLLCLSMCSQSINPTCWDINAAVRVIHGNKSIFQQQPLVIMRSIADKNFLMFFALWICPYFIAPCLLVKRSLDLQGVKNKRFYSWQGEKGNKPWILRPQGIELLVQLWGLLGEAPNLQSQMVPCRAGLSRAVPALCWHTEPDRRWNCSLHFPQAALRLQPEVKQHRDHGTWNLSQDKEFGLLLGADQGWAALPKTHSGCKSVGSPCTLALLHKLKHLNYRIPECLGWKGP